MRQAAGLLAAGGRGPSTGARNVTSLLKNVASGSAYLIRSGQEVTISLDTIRFNTGDAVWGSLLDVPVGFRPPFVVRANLTHGQAGHQVAVYDFGEVMSNRVYQGKTYEIRNVFTYATNDPWPTTLPGSAM